MFGAASVPQRNLHVRTGASSEFKQCSSRASEHIFLTSCHQQSRPSWGQEGLFIWGQATATGPRQVLSDTGGCDTPGLCQPWQHCALLRDPESSLFVRLLSGPPEEKHFHLSAGTYLFISRATGEGEESHEPQQLRILQKVLTGQRRKKVKGQGSPGESLPLPTYHLGETGCIR